MHKVKSLVALSIYASSPEPSLLAMRYIPESCVLAQMVFTGEDMIYYITVVTEEFTPKYRVFPQNFNRSCMKIPVPYNIFEIRDF